MDSDHRAAEEKKQEELEKKHDNHPKVHHPVRTKIMRSYVSFMGQNLCVKNLLLITSTIWHVLYVQGSRDQLEEVWEETDNLNKDEFDPKTFFHLHGTLV